MKKKDVKKNVLPHSQAKLDFYTKYLTRYLRILALSKYVDNINLYDLFCGTGIYDDGKAGSPILAFDAIKKLYESLESDGKPIPKVSLFVNDGKAENVSKVRSLIDKMNDKQYCKMTYAEDEASKAMSHAQMQIKIRGPRERNLLFIDPYGYKEIYRNDLLNILSTKKCEIILFLPISHMHRFSESAVREKQNPSYKELSRFINEFLPTNHPIKEGKHLQVLDYIDELKKAFQLNDQYYCASHYIQRDASNYNALFFITSNLLGLEKILEVKWELDESDGKGFRLNPEQLNLFGDELTTNKLEDFLETHLKEKQRVSNITLYEFVLKQGFLPKHSNKILSEWQKKGRIKVTDTNTLDKARRNSFYLSYKYYKEEYPKVWIQLI